MVQLWYTHVFETSRNGPKDLKPRMFPMIRSAIAQIGNEKEEAERENRPQCTYKKERFRSVRPSSGSIVTRRSDAIEESE